MRTNLKAVLKKYIKSYLAAVFLSGLCEAHAQKNIIPSIDSAFNKELAKSFTSQSTAFLSGLKNETEDKKLLKHYEARYKVIFKTLDEEIKEGQMLNVPPASRLLGKILDNIKAGNPDLPDVKPLLLREDVANAYTIGDGHLFIYLGLFHYLENEDQVASVLTHEIGHLLMKHTLKALSRSYEHDQQNISDWNRLQQVKVKKSDRAFELLKNSIYTTGKIKREFEMQADSVGFVLFKNTGYHVSAYLRALEIVEQRDTVHPDGLAVETYKRFFDLPGQPFDDKWLKVEDFSSYSYGGFTEKFDKDSVSSHPKTSERIQYLTTIFPELKQVPQGAAPTKASDAFNEVQALAKRARIPNLYINEQYGEVIYASLLHLQKEPDDVLHKQWLGIGFQKIYQARKDYQLNKFLDRISPKDQTQSYIQFLSFMWNLKLEELKSIADFYSNNNQ